MLSYLSAFGSDSDSKTCLTELNPNDPFCERNPSDFAK